MMNKGNAQRFVFTALLAVLALEFSSATKLQAIWSMAFSPNKTGTVTGSGLTPAQQQQIKQNAGGVSPDANGNCPTGYTNMGGVCMPNSVLGQI